MSEAKAEELVVMGATLQGFAQACVNLNIVAGRDAGQQHPAHTVPQQKYLFAVNGIVLPDCGDRQQRVGHGFFLDG